MEAIYILPKNHTPRVEFYPTGKLLIEGRSLPEDAAKIYNPLIDFAKKLSAQRVNFNINLEYFNSASSKRILEVLRALDSNSVIRELNVIWHYQKGDEDSVEIAEIFDECLCRTRFYFTEHSDIESFNKKVSPSKKHSKI
jgi:hypothetical protein